MDTSTSYKDAFIASLQRLKNKQVMTDVSLKLADETTIPCHKLVLMAASPFFETMLQSGMKESTQQEVQLDFSDAVTIKMLVDYFYSGEIDINAGNVQDLVAASEFLCLADLKKHLGAFMTDQIDSTNCIEFYRYARKFSLEKLNSHCLDYILTNYNQASRSIDTFTQLSEEELINVVSDDRLTTDKEDFVFHSVVRWVNADLEKRKEAFVKIASFIRFPFCTQALLDRVVGEDLMINRCCMDFILEANNVRSPLTHLHQMHSTRAVPRLPYSGKKQHLVRVYAYQRIVYDYDYGNRTKFFIKIESTACDVTEITKSSWWKSFETSQLSYSVINLFPSSEGIHWVDSKGSHSRWCVGMNNVTALTWVKPPWSGCSLTFIRDKFFVFGGQTNEQHCAVVESFDHQKSQWKPEPSMLQPCSNPYIVHFGTKVYIMGGVTANGPSLFTQEFDSVWGTWQLKKEMPGVCQSGAAVSLNDNIFVVGGTERSCFRYTPATDTWTVLSQPTHVHNATTAATAWKGRILLCGKDHGEDYNPDEDRWSPCSALVPTENGSPLGILLCTVFK